MQGVSFRKQTINFLALFPLQFHSVTVFSSRNCVPISLFWLKIWVQAPCSAAASPCSERPLGCVHTAPTEALVGQLAYSRTSPVSPWSRQAVFPLPMLRSQTHPPVLTALPCSSWEASYWWPAWVPGKSKCELMFPAFCRMMSSWLWLQLLYGRLWLWAAGAGSVLCECGTVWAVGWDDWKFIICDQMGSEASIAY